MQRARSCAYVPFHRYDMEDAMIINRSSLDRGFAHGALIKSETVDLAEKRGIAKVRMCAVQPEQVAPH